MISLGEGKREAGDQICGGRSISWKDHRVSLAVSRAKKGSEFSQTLGKTATCLEPGRGLAGIQLRRRSGERVLRRRAGGFLRIQSE